MPTSARSPTVHPCRLAMWPIVTSLPIVVLAAPSASPFAAVRITVPSWMFVRSPTVIVPLSPGEHAGALSTSYKAVRCTFLPTT
jgi:hypothetical protein